MSAKPYVPRHSVYSCYSADVEPVRAPGPAAWLRRHPAQVRKAVTAAVAAGALILGVS
jgi:hypothetical protein